jgi:hypothetical protein
MSWESARLKVRPSCLQVAFQRVNISLHAVNPTLYPQFKHLPKLSGHKSMSFEQLAAYLDATSDSYGTGLFNSSEYGQYASSVPAGMIFHEGRVGSTLVANSTCPTCRCCAHVLVVRNRLVFAVLAGVTDSLVYSEPTPVVNLFNVCWDCDADTL